MSTHENQWLRCERADTVAGNMGMLLVALFPQKHRRCSVAFSMHIILRRACTAQLAARQKARLGSAAVKALPRRRAVACVFVCVFAGRLKQRLQTFAFALECHTKVAEIDAAIEARRAALRRARL